MGFLYSHQHPNGSIEIQFNEKLKPEIFNPLFNKHGFKLLSCLTKVILQPKLSGGKGAFRQLMRNVGRTTTKSNNQSMARDLNGRRIRDVENEKRLAEWIENEAERKAERDGERFDRLQKIARRSKNEEERKTYLDASFDEESQKYMDMMAEAVEVSLTAADIKRSNKHLKRPAGYAAFKAHAKKHKTSFGFDESDFSDTSDEEEEEDFKEKTPTRTPSTIKRFQDLQQGGNDSGKNSGKNSGEDSGKNSSEEVGEFRMGTFHAAKKPEQPKPEEIIVPRSNKACSKFETFDAPEETSTIDMTKKKLTTERKFLSSMKYTDPSLNVKKQTDFLPIMMKTVESAGELERFGRDHLSHELKRRDCKSGGTCEQLAARLFAIKGLKKKSIPKKHRAKAPKPDAKKPVIEDSYAPKMWK
jgi:hypothetical protein